MTSVLSRTAASIPRRGATRSVPADRRRTPNAMTDSMSLQAVMPEVAPQARGRSAGRRGHGDQDHGAGLEGRSGSRTGPRTDPGRKGRGARRSGEPAAVQGDEAGLADEPRGLAAGAPSRAAGPREEGARPRDAAVGLDPLTGPRDAQPARSSAPAGGAGRRFGADGFAGALEQDDDGAPPGPRAPAARGGSADDRLAWFRHGWLGPLTVAVVVALVSLGVYVLAVGRGGGHAGGQDAAAKATLAPAGTNPDAKGGKSLVDGTYTCVAGAGPATSSAGATASTSAAPAASGPAQPAPGARTGTLVIPATSGKYQWQGQQGDYTIATPKFDDASNVIAAVAFTSGPLQGQVGNSIAVWPAGGRVQATVYVTKGGNMSCALN